MMPRLPNHILLLAMLCFSCLALPAHAQVGAKAMIDSTSVLVGGKRHIRLSVNYTPGVRLLEPVIAVIDTSEAIELLNATPWDTLSQTAQAIFIEKDLIITAWDSGFFAIPAIPVPYEIQGKTDTAFSNPLSLSVTLTPPDTVALQPLKPIIEEPAKLEDYVPYFIGILVATALLAIVWWLRKRKAQKPIAQTPAIEVPPHAIALDKLDQLDKAQLWQKGQFKEYHTQLTYILREYLENRFHILALESTSREIEGQLKHIVAEDLRQNIAGLLHTSDMVKFAKAELPVELHQQLLEQTRSFISATSH